MATNDFEVIDYLEQARGRYTEQFKGKPFFDVFVKIIINEMTSLQSAYKDLMQLRSLDTAVGAQLDVIGESVGQPRVLLDFTAFPYFGFDGSFGAESFGSVGNTTGGIFRSVFQEEGAPATVDDDTYRFLIKGRIAANSSRATPEDVIHGINFMTGNTSTILEELGNAKIRLTIQDTLTDLQKYFLQGLSSIGSIIPIPIGVSVEYVFV